MYDYIYRRLIEANLQNDEEMLNEVEQYVTDFRDAWKGSYSNGSKKGVTTLLGDLYEYCRPAA